LELIGRDICRAAASTGSLSDSRARLAWAAELLPKLATTIREEMEDPPERFRDPIMLTLMRDPVVLGPRL